MRVRLQWQPLINERVGVVAGYGEIYSHAALPAMSIACCEVHDRVACFRFTPIEAFVGGLLLEITVEHEVALSSQIVRQDLQLLEIEADSLDLLAISQLQQTVNIRRHKSERQ